MAARTTDEPTAAELTDQIAKLREDLADIAATVRDGVGAKIEANGGAALARATDAARGAEADAMAFVRDKPVQSLAIAAGLGLAFGLLTRRR
ncbi:MAG: ElaB/YqjD/DUF883 family membrane-anchored ribosome-binding protein [Paracoccaceae bacterium]|jgi:ElaB/YqjD/DUF883 family membrane-anchored ribosome-binding protein